MWNGRSRHVVGMHWRSGCDPRGKLVRLPEVAARRCQGAGRGLRQQLAARREDPKPGSGLHRTGCRRLQPTGFDPLCGCLRHGSASRTPRRSLRVEGQVDAVVSSHNLEHCDDPEVPSAFRVPTRCHPSALGRRILGGGSPDLPSWLRAGSAKLQVVFSGRALRRSGAPDLRITITTLANRA